VFGFAPYFGSYYLLAGAASSLGLALLAARLRKTGERFRINLCRATLVLLLLAVVMITIAYPLELSGLLLVGMLVGGAGVGFLQGLWGERFAAQLPHFSTVAAPGAAIFTALLVTFASEETTLIALAIFPLISFALLLMRTDVPFAAGMLWPHRATGGDGACSENEREGEPLSSRTKERTKERSDVSSADMLKLMISIAIFSFLCRSYDMILEQVPGPFALIGDGALLALIVVGVAFLIIAFVTKGSFNALLTYRLSLPIMVIGLAVLALFLERFAAISLLIINVGYEFFDILAWILFAEIARRWGQAFRVFGFGVAFMFIGMAFGYLLSPLIYGYLEQSGMQIMSFSLLSIISLVIVAFLVMPEGTLLHLLSSRSTDAADEETGEKADDADTLKDADSFEELAQRRARIVAEKYGLTARESEVLALLARGRTLSIIARNLQIANSTARTHIESIYSKLNVHKQQELIDLVESYREQG
jgi:DNA-binding CsgD family transcriptional regulator